MAKSKKRLTRYYYFQKRNWGPTDAWEDVPDQLKEREAYLDSKEYAEHVERREPSRDVAKENEERIKAMKAQEEKEVKEELIKKALEEQAAKEE